jgi:hypothetical protein
MFVSRYNEFPTENACEKSAKSSGRLPNVVEYDFKNYKKEKKWTYYITVTGEQASSFSIVYSFFREGFKHVPIQLIEGYP